MGYVAKLVRGAQYLDLSSGRYALGRDFKPGVDKLVIDQPYNGQLYQDDTGLYAGYDVVTETPTDLIVYADGVSHFGGDLINA